MQLEAEGKTNEDGEADLRFSTPNYEIVVQSKAIWGLTADGKKQNAKITLVGHLTMEPGGVAPHNRTYSGMPRYLPANAGVAVRALSVGAETIHLVLQVAPKDPTPDESQ